MLGWKVAIFDAPRRTSVFSPVDFRRYLSTADVPKAPISDSSTEYGAVSCGSDYISIAWHVVGLLTS